MDIKKKMWVGILLGMGMAASAGNVNISSPDGKLVVTVSDDGGVPSYTINYGDEVFLKPSPLGLSTNLGDYARDMALGQVAKSVTVEETYTLHTIKQSIVNYTATETVCPFMQQGKHIYDVVFRVSNHDVAFQYRLYPQGDTRCCIVRQEATSFVLPEGSTTFLCPQSKPMGGFARTSPSYETSYTVDDALGKNGWGEGYTFPCLFRNGDKGWVLISETGVNGRYCASRLIGHPDGSYTIGFPQPGENNGYGTVEPALALPGETPWRTLTVGDNLAPIVETTVPFDLVSRQYPASCDYIYGKGSWSWIIGMDGSTRFDEQKRYIDFSAAMGWQSVLVRCGIPR